MRYRKKPVVIEAITFEEFVQYGKDHGGSIVGGMPWSFEYQGHPVTHENDSCYLIPTLEGMHHFTPADMLITGVAGEIYPCKLDIFAATYEIAQDEPLQAVPTYTIASAAQVRSVLESALHDLTQKQAVPPAHKPTYG